MRLLVITILSALGAVVLVTVAPVAAADTTYIYWTPNNDVWAGRASIDGTNVNSEFFNSGGPSSGIAVDSQHIYWPVDLNGFSGTTIGRVNLDGTGANTSAINTTAVPYGIAIDATHIYWANHWRGSIGRANLDGTNANPDFITGISEPQAVAVDGTYVYWASFGPSPYTTTGKIGRAKLDGTDKDLSFITGAGNPQGVAVTSTHVYWTNGLGGIGRAGIDGSAPNQHFIASYGGPAGIAVTSDHIYWAEVTSFKILSANLDGSGASTLIDLASTRTSPHGSQPWGIAIHTVPGPSPTLPTLGLTAPATATVGTSVTLDGVTVGGDAAGQTFTLSMRIAGAGSSSSLGSVTGTAFPLAVHPAWIPPTAGTYTVTLELLDANSTVVVTASQTIYVSVPVTPTPTPASAPEPEPTPTPVVTLSLIHI